MRASAIVVGPADGPGAALRDLAQSLSFSTVVQFKSVDLAEQQAQLTPVCFFLFAAVDDVAILASTAREIRFCPSRRVRFAPLIYFSESASTETIRSCITMGFDDVITLPFSHDRVMGRLEHQLDRTLIYFETAGYIGPDRRGSSPAPRRQTGHYRRLEIVRSFANGVTVVKDEAHAAA